MTLKPRISWGKGISPPNNDQRFGNSSNNILENPDLKPQSQQGFDYGLEGYDKKGDYKFEVIYYDNILQDMFALQDLGVDPRDPDRFLVQYANVGKVWNRGWEFSGIYQIGPFSLRGTFSIMNATVKDSSHLLGQLSMLPGSRLVNLPRHTAGSNLTYEFPKLFRKMDNGSVSVNVTEVDGVKNTDYRTYTIDVAYGRTPYTPGSFGYPFEKSPVYRLGLYIDYYITPNFRFFTQGSNILNSYKYEYSTNFPTRGASWLFGIKFSVSKEGK